MNATQFFTEFNEIESKPTFLKIYYPFIKALGAQDGLLLSALFDRFKFHSENNELLNDGWFYLTLERCKELTGMGESAQKNRIKSLISKKLIESKNMGTPCKRYFRLNLKAIMDLFRNDLEVAAYQKAREEENKSKVQHLPKGRVRKSEVPQDGDTEIRQNAETGFSEMPKQESAKSKNIYKSPSKRPDSTIPEVNKTPSSKEIETKFSYLKPVREIAPKLPKEVVDKIESVIANSTYHYNRERYDEFCKYKWVLVRIYEDFKKDMSDLGFQNLFSEYLRFEGEIYNVSAFLRDRANRMLGLKESKYDEPITKPGFKKSSLTEQQKEEYRRMFSTFSGIFPWELYNEIFETSLTQEQIDEKRVMWQNLKRAFQNRTA